MRAVKEKENYVNTVNTLAGEEKKRHKQLNKQEEENKSITEKSQTKGLMRNKSCENRTCNKVVDGNFA